MQVAEKDPLAYLGCALSSDGRVDAELARRLGAAHADFKVLRRVWAHSSLAVRDKVQIFDACVISRLVHGMQTAWLSAASRRKLDGFQARCLRRILGILPAFLSRMSNAKVRQQSGCRRLTSRIREQQLFLAGRCMGDPRGTLIRDVMQRWIDGVPWVGGRSRGRPRSTWFSDVGYEALALAGSAERLECHGQRLDIWRKIVRLHCVAKYD